jgi:hypothetical protein
MVASLNANLRLSYSSKKTEVILKEGTVKKQDVLVSVRSGNGVALVGA